MLLLRELDLQAGQHGSKLCVPTRALRICGHYVGKNSKIVFLIYLIACLTALREVCPL